jgi:hypothetical protein
MSDVAVSWVTLFVLVGYLMGLACLCLAFRIGSAGRNWKRGIREVVVFLSFCALGYGVESWAHARTPYYFYSKEFPDRVARIPFDEMRWFRKHLEPRSTECLTYVHAHMPETREIPLSIPIVEGALAFAALWTARCMCRVSRTAIASEEEGGWRYVQRSVDPRRRPRRAGWLGDARRLPQR